MASVGYLQTLPCLLLGVLLIFVVSVHGGEYCRSFGRYTYSVYCPGECCGYYYNRYCCNYNWSGGAIAGMVIGCIVGLGLMITLIVCLCAACNKNRATTGRVVYPNTQQPSVAIVNTNTHTGHVAAYPQQGMIHPPPPLLPQGQAYPPPGPAYPPPPPAYQPQGPAYPPSNPGQFVPPPKYSAT